MPKDLQKNFLLLNIYSILIKRVSMPIIVLYFLLNNLTLTEVGILASTIMILTLVTEIHGGIFADKKGKKLAMALHAILGVLTMFFYFIGNSFWVFFVASVCYGLAGAFITGTREAFMYDSLVGLKKEKEFKKYNGRNTLYAHSGNALVLLAIPWIYSIDPKLPFLIGICFFVGALITTIPMTEPKVREKSKQTRGYNKILFDSLKEVLNNKKLMLIILLSIISSAFVYASTEFNQPILLLSGTQLIFFGIVYTLLRISSGIGAEIAHYAEKKSQIKTMLAIGFGFIFLSFLGISILSGIYLIILILFLGFSVSFIEIISDDEVSKRISPENRTTIFSISSMSQHLAQGIIVIILAVLADTIGVREMFFYAAIIFALCFIIAVLIYSLISKKTLTKMVLSLGPSNSEK